MRSPGTGRRAGRTISRWLFGVDLDNPLCIRSVPAVWWPGSDPTPVPRDEDAVTRPPRTADIDTSGTCGLLAVDAKRPPVRTGADIRRSVIVGDGPPRASDRSMAHTSRVHEVNRARTVGPWGHARQRRQADHQSTRATSLFFAIEGESRGRVKSDHGARRPPRVVRTGWRRRLSGRVGLRLELLEWRVTPGSLRPGTCARPPVTQRAEMAKLAGLHQL